MYLISGQSFVCSTCIEKSYLKKNEALDETSDGFIADGFRKMQVLEKRKKYDIV